MTYCFSEVLREIMSGYNYLGLLYIIIFHNVSPWFHKFNSPHFWPWKL